jgi:Cu(I)/Ag(I) efflux system membrane fusion protein
VEAGEKVVTNGTLLIDGQAEMNRSFSTAPKEPKADAPALDDTQIAAITEFIETADAMSAALAADDLTAFNKASEPAMMIAGKMGEALELTVPQTDLAALEKSRHFHGSETIADARAAFLKFSMAANAILEPLRSSPALSDFHIFECPMVDQAVPGADKKGRWIQIGDRPMRNPYFGDEMLTCGKEIKP